jgi:uncharacterized protein with HEPN domain
MNEFDRQWLTDMLESARDAASLLGSRGVAELDTDRRTLLAVRLAIQTIGEAATRVSPQARADLPDVPWSDIIGMRHRLVHGYRAISTVLIVETVRGHIPPLIKILESAGLDEGAK